MVADDSIVNHDVLYYVPRFSIAKGACYLCGYMSSFIMAFLILPGTLRYEADKTKGLIWLIRKTSHLKFLISRSQILRLDHSWTAQ
jgi:hypothetical protein